MGQLPSKSLGRISNFRVPEIIRIQFSPYGNDHCMDCLLGVHCLSVDFLNFPLTQPISSGTITTFIFFHKI